MFKLALIATVASLAVAAPIVLMGEVNFADVPSFSVTKAGIAEANPDYLSKVWGEDETPFNPTADAWAKDCAATTSADLTFASGSTPSGTTYYPHDSFAIKAHCAVKGADGKYYDITEETIAQFGYVKSA